MWSEAEKLRVRLDHLIQRGVSHLQDEDKSHFARYLCILVSGYLELSIQDRFSRYIKVCSHPRIHAFADWYSSGIYNCRFSKVCDSFARLDSRLQDELQERTADDVRDALDSIVANKNLIAHGRNTGITFARVKNYYSGCKSFVAQLSETLGL
jgi:hypothetical protein